MTTRDGVGFHKYNPPFTESICDICIVAGGCNESDPLCLRKHLLRLKAVEKKAGEIGDDTAKAAKDVEAAAKKKWQELTGGKKASSSAIPHGCSPVTTPCE